MSLFNFRGKKALSKKKLKRRQKVKSKVKSRTKVSPVLVVAILSTWLYFNIKWHYYYWLENPTSVGLYWNYSVNNNKSDLARP